MIRPAAALILFAALAPAACAPIARAQAAPAQLDQQRQRVLAADYRVTGRLVRVDANGTRTTEQVKILAHGFGSTLRVLFEVAEPASARARLLVETHTDGRAAILAAHPGDKAAASLPFEQWSDGPLGPAFSYEDLLESALFWASQSNLGAVNYGARPSIQIRSTPGAADRSHYASILTWLDRSSGLPVHMEKTPREGGPVKEFTALGIRKVEGVWSASEIEVKLRGRSGSTHLIFDRGSAHAHLTERDFAADQLAHFQAHP